MADELAESVGALALQSEAEHEQIAPNDIVGSGTGGSGGSGSEGSAASSGFQGSPGERGALLRMSPPMIIAGPVGSLHEGTRYPSFQAMFDAVTIEARSSNFKLKTDKRAMQNDKTSGRWRGKFGCGGCLRQGERGKDRPPCTFNIPFTSLPCGTHVIKAATAGATPTPLCCAHNHTLLGLPLISNADGSITSLKTLMGHLTQQEKACIAHYTGCYVPIMMIQVPVVSVDPFHCCAGCPSKGFQEHLVRLASDPLVQVAPGVGCPQG